MDRRTFVTGSAVVGAGLAAGCGAREGAIEAPPFTGRGKILIDGASVFDARAGVMQPSRSILIDDGLIQAVAPAGELNVNTELAAGASRVNGAGRYVIPGLIDAHVHLSHILYQSQMTGDEVLPFYLGHGVTSIRSTGDNVPAQRLVERYAIEHPELSPNVFRCSFLIDGDPPWHPDVGWALTKPEEVAPFVADMAAWGVRTLKLYIGVEREIGRRVIEEGHKHGLVVSGHLLDYHVADAVRDGLDCIEHIYTVSNFMLTDPDDRHSIDLESDEARQLVDLIAERETRVDPTLIVFWGTLLFMDQPEVINHSDHAAIPQRLRAFWEKDRARRALDWGAAPLATRERTWDQYRQLTTMLHEAGVQLLVGTDAPEPQVAPGGSLHHEMEFLVECGLSPAEVLTAATLENAKILKEEERRGTIEGGKMADLVVLDADPMADIRNSRQVSSVVMGGQLLDPQEILREAALSS